MASFLSFVAIALAVVFMVWLVFILPANMAQARNRGPLVWVLISLFFSPLLAVLLLLALGPAPEEH